ncbi:MAG: amidase [Pseudomonadota bacterium]
MTPRAISLLSAFLLCGCDATPPPPSQAESQTKTEPAGTPEAQSGGDTDDDGQVPALLRDDLPTLAAKLRGGDITSEALVSAYLARINAIDRAGPQLQSVLTVNPDALRDARALDALLADGTVKGPLHGVPILLKDNIESADAMATTAGAMVLKENVTGRDSPLVAGLRASGAVILGKTNLSQWANFRSNGSISGWSALGGQVRNPHMLDRSPCGSSSGSGAAMAASLAAGTVGTETNGSIICPSNVNGIVGFKPTVGLVSQQYIVPISSSQDTAGPMTKTVRGAAMMLSAMAQDGADTLDYSGGLDASALDGVRVGVLRFSVGDNADIAATFDKALEVLKAAGATLVEIEEFSLDTEDFWTKSRNVLYHEFKATLNDYLAQAAPAVTARTLDAVIAFNKDNAARELALFDQSIFEAAAPLAGLDDETYQSNRDEIQRATGPNGIDALLATHNVRVLVSPSGPLTARIDPINGDVWPDWSGGGYLAAIAGYPHLSVPMGTVHGLPLGLSFIGTKNQDADILAYGFAYEARSRARVDPAFMNSAFDRPEIKAATARP